MRRAHAGMGATVAVVACALMVGLSEMSPASTAPRSTAAPGVLQPGHCYRIAFPIEGAPNYKILELADGNWIKAEVDAGPASARRQPMWINAAQIVTLRETPCSD